MKFPYNSNKQNSILEKMNDDSADLLNEKQFQYSLLSAISQFSQNKELNDTELKAVVQYFKYNNNLDINNCFGDSPLSYDDFQNNRFHPVIIKMGLSDVEKKILREIEQEYRKNDNETSKENIYCKK